MNPLLRAPPAQKKQLQESTGAWGPKSATPILIKLSSRLCVILKSCRPALILGLSNICVCYRPYNGIIRVQARHMFLQIVFRRDSSDEVGVRVYMFFLSWHSSLGHVLSGPFWTVETIKMHMAVTKVFIRTSAAIPEWSRSLKQSGGVANASRDRNSALFIRKNGAE